MRLFLLVKTDELETKCFWEFSDSFKVLNPLLFTSLHFFAGCPFDEQVTGSSSVGQSKDKFNRGSENLRSGREKDEEGSIGVDMDTAVDNSFVTAFAPKKAER